MNKCEHGQKITHFCASQCCVWKDAAGCQTCIKKYHNHMGPTIFLKEDDIVSIVKKYTVQHSVKPKCRLFQQAIYNYFNLIKTEISSSIDAACKNIINQIGYPYLYYNNALPTYKRLKNKQYKKLVQKQFRALYELTSKIDQKQLSKQQAKIYIIEIKNTLELMNNLENWMKSYQTLIKGCNSTFVHDNSLIYKINQISKNLNIESPNKNKIKQFKDTSTAPSNFSSFANTYDKDKQIDLRIEEIARKMDQKQNNTLNTPNDKKQNRQISLDKRIIKDHKFSTLGDSTQQKQKNEKSNKNIQVVDKLESVKKELNGKEIQINEKKKMLIDLMKNKEESLKNAKEKSNGQIQKEIKSPQKLEIPTIFKRDSKTDSINDGKDSNNSSQMEEDINKILNQETKGYAYAKLPIQEGNIKRVEQKSEVKKKLIVVPTIPTVKFEEIQSPLLKKKNKLEQSRILKESTEIYDQKKEIKKDVMPMIALNLQNSQTLTKKEEPLLEIKENQEKSLALLLKSLSLKAEEAIPLLESSIKFAQNNLSAAEYLSYLYLQVNRPKDCLNLCNKILQKLQHSVDFDDLALNINNNKTAALNVLGRYSQSIVILQKCLKSREKDTLFKNLGDAYFSISIYEKAIYNYQKAVKLCQNYDQAHYNLAVCLYIQENFYNSKLAIKKALEFAPKNEVYLQLLTNIQSKISVAL